MLTFLIACQGSNDKIDLTPTSSVVGAECIATDNSLRFACTASLESAAPTTWTVKEGETIIRQVEVAADANPAFILWGLPPDRSLNFEVSAGEAALTGSLQTGSLPTDLDDLSLTVTGGSGTDAILMGQTCNGTTYLVMASTTGEIVWYEGVELASGGSMFPMGYSLSNTDTIVYEGGATAGEVDFGEGILWSKSDFERPVHHLIYKHDSYTYVINAGEYDNKVIDGFYILDEAGNIVKDWEMQDHLEITGTGTADPLWSSIFPGATDWSHTNSIWSDGKTVTLSLRLQNAILNINADQTDSAFGDVNWTITGASSDIISDYSFSDRGGFSNQHSVIPVDCGLLMFDNGGMNQDSRGLQIQLNNDGTAQETASWPLSTYCDNEGSTFILDNGNAIVTCAPDNHLEELNSTGEAVWTMTASCKGSGSGPPGGGGLSRGIPVTLK